MKARNFELPMKDDANYIARKLFTNTY